MNMALRLLLIGALLALLWPELARYRAEWQLAEASGRLDRALRGVDKGAPALASVAIAETLAHDAGLALHGDPRVPLLEGVAMILQGKGAPAVALFKAAIAIGERPEFTLNLGRARSVLGDESGASVAFLRTAWASQNAIDTLPSAMRLSLLKRTDELDLQLRAGQLKAPPPLN